jgi:hypothetical protein
MNGTDEMDGVDGMDVDVFVECNSIFWSESRKVALFLFAWAR